MTEKSATNHRLVAVATIAALALPLAMLTSAPASAQCFLFGCAPPQQQPQFQQPQNQNRERREEDSSKAPAAKKPETPPTSTVVVMGDSMADWLAYGLEEAFADNTPEIGVIRRPKAYSGLIRYEARGDLEWQSVARDIMNNEKPTVAVMILGLADRGPIRERPGAKPAPALAGTDTPGQPDSENPDTQVMAPERPKGRGSVSEFRSEVWAEAYSKKIADTISAMKSKGVPVIWVGLPSIRGVKSTSEAQYLNELYRAAAEKAGIIYVDVWEGFVDESGKYNNSGPDVDGQTRRLRSNDGVYFTKYGARKLAHFVEREIQRVMTARATPVALPVDTQPAAPRPNSVVARPVVGAVLPLTAGIAPASDELLGGNSMRPAASDPIASRVLVKGEPVSPLKGRADDFVWKQGSGAALPTANLNQEPGTITPVEIPVASPAQDEQKKTETQAANQPRRPRPAAQPAPAPTPFFSPFSFFRR
jgi:hypothetical protein